MINLTVGGKPVNIVEPSMFGFAVSDDPYYLAVKAREEVRAIVKSYAVASGLIHFEPSVSRSPVFFESPWTSFMRFAAVGGVAFSAFAFLACMRRPRPVRPDPWTPHAWHTGVRRPE